MYSFSKSKFQTGVVVFLVTLFSSVLSWSADPAPAAAPAGAYYPPPVLDCNKAENVKKAGGLERCIALAQGRTGDPRCESLSNEYRSSIKECGTDCRSAVETCAGSSDDNIDAIMNGIGPALASTQLSGLTAAFGGTSNCRMTYDQARSEKKDLKSDIDKKQKDINDLQDSALKAQEDYQKELDRIREDQERLMSEIDEIKNDISQKELENSKEAMEKQFELDEKVRQMQSDRDKIKNALFSKNQELQKMAVNNNVDDMKRVCIAQVDSQAALARDKACKDNPKNCGPKVMNGLGSAIGASGYGNAGRAAQVKSCLNNMVLDFSQKVSQIQEEMKNLAAQARSADEAVASIQKKQQDEVILMNKSLELAKNSANSKIQLKSATFQRLEQNKLLAQQNYNNKLQEIARKQKEYQMQLSVAQGEYARIGEPAAGIPNGKSGREAASMVASQDEILAQGADACCSGDLKQTYKMFCDPKRRPTAYGGGSGFR